MVVIRGLLRERQFISAPIKIICPRRRRGLMIILPARQSRAKVKCIAHERSECVGKAFIGPDKLPSS